MELIIHGGLTKTGSTSIQVFLTENSKAMAEHGIYYPVGYLNIHKRQHSPLVAALKAGNTAQVREFARRSREGAEAAGATKVIWSGESIGNMRPEDMPTLLEIARKEGGATSVRVIVYFRNLYDRLISRLNQQTKGRHEIVDDGFVDRMNKVSPSKQIAAWEAAVGAENVDIRIFDEAVKVGLEKDFLQAIGVPWSDDYVILPPINSSFDPITAQMFNMIRVEWGLPTKFMRNCERQSKKYRLPVLRSRTMNLVTEMVEDADLSHPKLAAHREVLTRLNAPDLSRRPPLPDFIDDLVNSLTYLKTVVEQGNELQTPKQQIRKRNAKVLPGEPLPPPAPRREKPRKGKGKKAKASQVEPGQSEAAEAAPADVSPKRGAKAKTAAG